MRILKEYFLIVDYGSQYTQLIARTVRELGFYTHVCHASHTTQPKIPGQAKTPVGIVLSGGPESVLEKHAPKIHNWVFQLNQTHGVPILGICYGMQALAKQLNAVVEKAHAHEYGYASIQTHGNSILLRDLYDKKNEHNENILDVWMSHGDHVQKPPTGFISIASTKNCPVAGFACEKKAIYGLQFHPEVTHTPQGKKILARFCADICKANAQWRMNNICKQLIEEVKQNVGNQHVVLGLSGGVDSSVVAALLHKAIGKQLHCILVDNGLLRLNECVQIEEHFAHALDINLHIIDAKNMFMSALEGVEDPEKKRKIIGTKFIEVFESAAKTIKGATWLAQGTIYSDVIESAAEQSGHVIKSHHNVGGLPEKMNLKLLEPLRKLFKDEVRKLGIYLDVPERIVQRHPFPGPGLGVRILGAVDTKKANILRAADAIFIDELKKNNWYYRLSQAFCVFLPIRSVGVVGDARRYNWVIALRAVQTVDFMTAQWAHLPYDLLGNISNRIVNEVEEVSRVVYDISGKPPATIEWE